MKLNDIPNKYLFILTLMFLCQGLIVLTSWLIYYTYGKENPINEWKIITYFIMTMLPFFILLNVYLLSNLYKNKWSRNTGNVITTIITLVIYIIATMLQQVFIPVYKAPQYISHTRENYKTEVINNYKYMKPTYFPDEIPLNARNYCCFSYPNINYLRFNTDTKYLDDTIAKNKANVDKIMNLKEFETDYPNVYSIFKPYFSIKDSDKYQVHLFKQSLYRNFDYYGGFITLKETGEIIFFNLDTKYYKEEFRSFIK